MEHNNYVTNIVSQLIYTVDANWLICYNAAFI